MVYRENVERYFAPFDHRGPIYLYVYVIFGLMAPWSVFLPAALVQAHQRDARTSTPGLSPGQREGNVDCFVLVFFWTTFIFFTLSGSRRSYYILPILPAAAILVARAFTDAEADLSESVQRLLKIGYGLVIAVVAFSIVVVPAQAVCISADGAISRSFRRLLGWSRGRRRVSADSIPSRT
jgi:4-amino-4-deoxy-L-arabinose transferase-like glycosyltransferase